MIKHINKQIIFQHKDKQKQCLLWFLFCALVLVSCNSSKTITPQKTRPQTAPEQISHLVFVSNGDGLSAFQVPQKTQLWDRPVTLSTMQSQIVTDSKTLYYAADKLYALNQTDGRQLWSDPLNEKVQGMIMHSGVLYLTSAGILSAIQTKDGSLLWHTNTTVALDPSVNLIADDQHVYLPYLNSILAMDTTTGKISWDATLPGNERAKSIHIDGNILAVQTDRRMLAFNTQNGHQLWQKKAQVVTANIINDTLYVVLYNTAQNSNGSPGIQALNLHNGKARWKVMMPTTSSGVGTMDTNALYWVSGPTNGDITAWSIVSGQQLWHTQSNTNYTRIVTNNNQLAAITDDGTISMLNTTNGKQMWQQTANVNHVQDAQIQDTMLYVIDDTGVINTFSEQGTPIWDLRAGPSITQYVIK